MAGVKTLKAHGASWEQPFRHEEIRSFKENCTVLAKPPRMTKNHPQLWRIGERSIEGDAAPQNNFNSDELAPS